MSPASAVGRVQGDYALIMPARNEERFIRTALASVVNQTCLPRALIVALNDCSDGTSAIVESFQGEHPWISVYRRDFGASRNYSKKALIFKEAFERLEGLELGFIGNLDADIRLPPEYYRWILDRFARDPRLGIAGGAFFEMKDGLEKPNHDSYENSVSGMTQLFRMACYRNVGGYKPITTGGVDMAAETLARFHGWSTRTFPEIRFEHLRPLGTAESALLSAKYREGVRDFHMGYAFLFHLLKCIRRIPERPVLLGSLARLVAFCGGYFSPVRMALDSEERKFLRMEQRQRILSAFHFPATKGRESVRWLFSRRYPRT